MGNLLQDFRYAARTLWNKPGFTAAGFLVLALGIGANTAVFSLVNGFLLKPLKIHNPEELLGCYSRDSKKPDSYRAFSYPNYIDLRDRNPVFSSLSAHDLAMVGVAEGETTHRVFADIVSSNYFDTFGVPLYRGRPFTLAEEKPGPAPVAIASYSYWKKTGADPELVGKSLRLNGSLFTVVGITQEGFTGTLAMVSSELYLPLGVYGQAINDFDGPARPLGSRDNHRLILVGRLRPGVTAKIADAKLAVIAAQLEKAYPADNKDQTFIARPLSRLGISPEPRTGNEMRLPAILLLSMASVVLLIASLNLANMMLAKGTARRKEIAIRLAIGAGRSRIVKQLLTEGLLLAILGGTAGLFIASWSTSLLVKSMTRMVPIDLVFSTGPDIRVLAATLGFCLVSTIVFSLGPAFKLSRPELTSDLKESAGEDFAAGALRLFSRRNLLVMAQLSLSLMMLAAAGLFVRSALRAGQVNPGFALDHEALAEVDPSLAGYDQVRGRQIYTNLLERLERIPGVESVALAATVPFGMESLGKGIQPAGGAANTTPVPSTLNIVTGDYFKTLQIPLLAGRSFRTAENNAPSNVAIVSTLAARKLWPGGNALGKHIRVDADEPGKPQRDLEVVGVVGNVQDRIIGEDLQPHLYLPFGQRYQSDMQIHLKLTARGPEAEGRVLEAVRRELRAVDDRLPVLALRTLRDHLESGVDLWIVRTGARMLSIFGAVALLLAVIGLYGVKAYTVACRTREIGIRMALGADSSDTLRMILREGLLVTLAGVSVGLVLALALGKVLSGILYQVSAVEPVVLVAAPLVLTAVSLLACYVPARRAARVDPMVALRYQ